MDVKTPWASIARIEVDGAHSGTGFLVTRKHVLTALHVVADATGRPFPGILLRFDTNAEYGDNSKVFETRAHIEEGLWSAEYDFALLECDQAPPSEPLGLSDRCQQLDPCSSAGFAIQKPSGFTVIGDIASLNDPMAGGVTAIGIQFQFGSGVLMKGHSGAAVFVNNRVVGLLRTAFLDDSKRTMGGIVHATSIQQVVAFCNRLKPGLLAYHSPIVWPAPLPTQGRILADRRAEFEIFTRMITGQSKERVLLLKGESGSGKTVLSNELMEYARGLRVEVARADCKGCPSMDSILATLLFDLPPGFLPETEKAVGALRFFKMIEDLIALDRPLLIALDTWQDSSEEVRKWIEQRLLPGVPRMPGVVALIGGHEVPKPAQTWGDFAAPRQLEPITSAEDWFEYTQRRWPSVSIPKERVETITLAVGPMGRPNVIDGLLDGLQGGLLALATPGGR